MACSCPRPVLADTLQQITLALSLLLLLQQHLVHGDSQNITAPILGASFTPLDNTHWVSPNHTFALGFLQVPTPDGFPQSFALSIFYFQLPQPSKTVVWRANRGYLLSRNSSFLLTQEGDLVLTDNGTTVWNTNTSGLGVTSASLTDGGNLILNRTSSKVWESWMCPTDTLLPGQALYSAANPVAMRLTPSGGRYFLQFNNTDGVVSLYFTGGADVPWFAYYSSDTSAQTYTSLYFNPSGQLVLLDDSTKAEKVILRSSSNQSLSQRIVMGNEGSLTLWDLSADGMSWSADQQQLPPDGPCSVIGRCGFYGICRSSDDICSCPPGFEFVNVADTAEGCRPTHPIDCYLGTQMVKLQGVQYPYFEYYE